MTSKNKKVVKPLKSKKKNIKYKTAGKKKNYNILLIITFFIGIILIAASYAWFYASLDVNVKFFNMIVSNNNGLYISYDGVNFGSTIEISEDVLINKLKDSYPNNTSQWSGAGLKPVSTVGILSGNDDKFRIFENGGFKYNNKKKEYRILTTYQMEENTANSVNNYIAFDLFLKNVTGSPISDNLYLDSGTNVTMETNTGNEEMHGLVNSLRIGFLKIGSVPIKSNVNAIQSITCNNNCEAVIYEPNSTNHTALSSERAKVYGLNIVDGNYYPTYAVFQATKKIDIRKSISGSVDLDTNYFQLQQTRTDFTESLFQIPDGITKVRVYVWIEGQDIDSLETHSHGADLSITINLIKDTAGYDYYN